MKTLAWSQAPNGWHYTPWRRKIRFATPDCGSRWYFGNFTLGVTIDSHPRFFTVAFGFLFFEIIYHSRRDAVQDGDQ